MSFDFRVVFTGICTFVPHSEGNQLCVLLPDATNADYESKRALDSEKLSRHQGFFEFDPRNAGFKFSDSLRALWELERPGGRLQFRFEGGSGDRDFAKPPDVISIEDLCDDESKYLAKVAPWALHPERPRHPAGDPRVLAQVLFDRGVVTSRKPSPSSWYLLGTLGRPRDAESLAHEIQVTVTGVEEARILFTPFGVDQKTETVLTFAGTSPLPVEVVVANLCEENPLRWPLAVPPERSPDIDFKWHYEVLADPDAIRDVLRENWLPCPIRLRSRMDADRRAASERSWIEATSAIWDVEEAPSFEAAAAATIAVGGDNCYSGFAAPADFDFPDPAEE